jgi:hypothetical protein
MAVLADMAELAEGEGEDNDLAMRNEFLLNLA